MPENEESRTLAEIASSLVKMQTNMAREVEVFSYAVRDELSANPENGYLKAMDYRLKYARETMGEMQSHVSSLEGILQLGEDSAQWIKKQ